MKITKHANEDGIANAIVKYMYMGEFPGPTESTVRGWLKKYPSQLGANVTNLRIVVSAKTGRPLYLPE